VLHEHVLLLTIETSMLPKVGAAEQLKFEPLEAGFARALLKPPPHCGYSKPSA
jgi:hypothetical protein